MTGSPATAIMLELVQDIHHCGITSLPLPPKGPQTCSFCYLQKISYPCSKEPGVYTVSGCSSTALKLSLLFQSNPLDKYVREPLSWGKCRLVFSPSDSRITEKRKTFCLRFLPSGSCSQALLLLTVF